LAVPIINIKVSDSVIPNFNFKIIRSQILGSSSLPGTASSMVSSFKILWLLQTIYITIVLLLSIRFITNIHRLSMYRKNNPSIIINGINIVMTNQKTLPYSFLNSVFLNKFEYENRKVSNEILTHEYAHIRQNHSLDVILLEVIQIFFWYNPLILFYKKAIKLNHEYLADSYVLKLNNDLIEYQKQLIDIEFRNKSTYLASNFNHLLTKKRLIMMTKNKTKSIGYKIALVPFLALFLFNFMSCSKDIILTNSNVESWWSKIAAKHGIELHAYNGFNSFVEMGSTNSIDNNTVTLENAIFIIKGTNDQYMIIRSPLAHHDLIKKSIEMRDANFEVYSFNSSDLTPIKTYSIQDFKCQSPE
jgi:hypothetical protein